MRRGWCAAAALLAGCQAVPADHELVVGVGRAWAPLRARLDPSAIVTHFGQSVGRLKASVARIDAPAALGRMRQSWVDHGSRILDDASRAPAQMQASVTQSVTGWARDAQRVVAQEGTLRTAFDPARMAQDTRRAFAGAPRALGLDREPWPDSTSASRQTDVIVETRRRSWFERVISRLF